MGKLLNLFKNNTTGHRCPRRNENPSSDTTFPGPDFYGKNHGLVNGIFPACSYCGSISGDDFMRFVKEGGRVDGSDKNYKVYLEQYSGKPAEYSTKTIRSRLGSSWTAETLKPGTGMLNSKFYFQHLSIEQRKEFVDLWNQKKINHNLYVWPFFMAVDKQ